jgi:cytochrome P450/NADPH-cytochrome P450 reductase
VFASIIQKFDLISAEPADVEMQMKFTLTVKPHFHVRAVPRAGRRRLVAAPSSGLAVARREGEGAVRPGMKTEERGSKEGKKPMYVLYGSNTGSAEAFAQRIATGAPGHGELPGVLDLISPLTRSNVINAGFSAKLGTLDSAAQHLPTDGPVIIVTASYEGPSLAPRPHCAHTHMPP